jgi:hypothetical protein
VSQASGESGRSMGSWRCAVASSSDSRCAAAAGVGRGLCAGWRWPRCRAGASAVAASASRAMCELCARARCACAMRTHLPPPHELLEHRLVGLSTHSTHARTERASARVGRARGQASEATIDERTDGRMDGETAAAPLRLKPLAARARRERDVTTVTRRPVTCHRLLATGARARDRRARVATATATARQ